MRLQCHNLSFSYPGTDITILENMNCAFSREGFHSVFGPSGVGKSSFAKLIAQANSTAPQKHQGQITLDGIEKILYSYNLERLPGWENTGKHLDKIVAPEKNALKKRLIDIFEIAPLLGSRFHKLSMGQQNRVNLIRYLLQDFDLLILDESLANVDEKLRQTIIVHIKEIFPEKMFLYISHNLMEVSSFCDEIMVFGTCAKEKHYRVIEGQNCELNREVDKRNRDVTMLEIMNAF